MAQSFGSKSERKKRALPISVPSSKHKLPDAFVLKETDDVMAAIMVAKPFEARLSVDRCNILIPLAAGAVTLHENEHGSVSCLNRAYALTYLSPGKERVIRQKSSVELLLITAEPHRAARILRTAKSGKWRLPQTLIEHRHSDIASIAKMLRRHILEPVCPNMSFLSSTADLLLSHAIGSTCVRAAELDGTEFTNGSLQRVLSDIDSHLETGIRIADLATNAGLTPSTFSRRFRATIGCSPQRFIIERRITKARQMLQQTDLTISEIAYTLGFSSQAHMTSSFKDLIGVAPGRYRQNHQIDSTVPTEVTGKKALPVSRQTKVKPDSVLRQ
ncbi:AraC family transcriptional regulator [Ruegeria sp. SCPT10]|uniref:AraC family transcriptional regulator n=1 Tax=Ruegeria sp. SCP10 TaxID=3141377 RepID=UPI00333BC373